MSLALNKENFFWHKVHSLTGIVPVGYYMAQHLVLNSYSLAGADKFNGVIAFFESLPKYVLLTVEALGIWLPLLFHAIYGIFIVYRAQPNFIGTKYGWSQNRMYTLQRWTGIIIFAFLCYHVATTTATKYLTNNPESIMFDAWHAKLTSMYGLWLVVYLVGIAASSYHLAYGIWNFCIRWGITISESAQRQVQKVSLVVFLGLTLIGWGALAGFLINPPKNAPPVSDPASASAMIVLPNGEAI